MLFFVPTGYFSEIGVMVMRISIFLIWIGLSFASGQQVKIVGVPVLYGEAVSKLPVQWRREPVKGKVVPAEQSEVGPILKKLESGMKKYPDYLLRENLAGVQLVHQLIFFEQFYPGTYTHNRIWLALANGNRNWTPEFLESVFHQEMSSILFHNYSRYFNASEWNNLVPEGMKWANSYYFNPDSVQLGIDPAWLERGFLNAWAATSMENDFNAFSARLFSGTRDFWTLTDRYPLIRKKVLLCLQFYHSLDRKFTEAYFKSLAVKSAGKQF